MPVTCAGGIFPTRHPYAGLGAGHVTDLRIAQP